jgi:ferredoxin
MRVIIDETLCEGNAECMKIAPEVFVVGDDDRARLLVERPSDTSRARIEAAVRRCPRQALSIRDD